MSILLLVISLHFFAKIFRHAFNLFFLGGQFDPESFDQFYRILHFNKRNAESSGRDEYFDLQLYEERYKMN